MSALMRDGTAEPYSPEQTLRREWGERNGHEQDCWQTYPVDVYSAKSGNLPPPPPTGLAFIIQCSEPESRGGFGEARLCGTYAGSVRMH